MRSASRPNAGASCGLRCSSWISPSSYGLKQGLSAARLRRSGRDDGKPTRRLDRSRAQRGAVERPCFDEQPLENLSRQVEPLWISGIDQGDLLLPPPFLELLFTSNRIGRSLVRFDVNQSGDIVVRCMDRHSAPMLFQPPPHIGGDADVQGSPIRAGENVDDRLTGHDGLYYKSINLSG